MAACVQGIVNEEWTVGERLKEREERRSGVCRSSSSFVFLFFVLSLFLTLSRQQRRFLKLNETADAVEAIAVSISAFSFLSSSFSV